MTRKSTPCSRPTSYNAQMWGGERRQRARLAFEARAQLRVLGEGRAENFDGNDAIEPRVARSVHLAHAAGAERREDFIGAEPSPGLDGHG